MKKRVLSLLLAIVMVVSLFPAAMAAESGFAPKEDTAAQPGPLELTQREGIGTTLKEPEESTSFAPAKDPVQAADGTVAKAENDGSKLAEGQKRFSENKAAKTYEADDVVTFIVVTKDAPLMSTYSTDDIAAQTASVKRHEKKQLSTLERVKSKLQKAFGQEESFELGYTYTVATSGVAVTTAYGNKEEIEAMSGVDHVYVAPVFSLPENEQGGTYDPLTSNASTMIGADVLNQSGYTGKGTKIAIIDTGIVLNHPSFGALSADQLTDASMTEASVQEVWNTLNASQRTTQANGTYYNTKIPYRFNYYSGTFDVSHYSSDHGTHVAGISAANKVDSTSVVGIAPEAQLVVMQVFTPQGGANWTEILAALEDCVRLKVDSANLSLGSAAGFTDTADMIEVMKLFQDSDIQVLIAGGNDTNNAYQNRFGLNMSLAADPDNGLVGTPSTYSAALSVASAENNGAELLYFTVNDRKIGYSDTAVTVKLLSSFQGQTLTFVPVPGYGEASDYEGVDVTGKVALVSRGSTSFPDKQKMAQSKGAIACVVYNNAAGVLNMQINDGAGNIPCVAISKADGQYLLEQYKAGVDALTVCNGDLIKINYDNSMSEFSSWGPTPDLKLKPEITGVGGNIYSSVDPSISGSNYGTMSGTSMATPQIAGAMAVLTQYLREQHPELKDAALRQTAANLLMSTASPILDGEVEYSPRNQGAGLADLVKATSSNAYLSNPAATEGRPKAELGESANGVYTFNFAITNMSSDQALTYSFDSSLLAPALEEQGGLKFMSNSDTPLDGSVTITKVRAASFLYYDFNDDGQVTTADARVLLRHVIGSAPMPKSNQHYAYLDVNGDGKVDRADVKVMLDYFAELPVDVDLLAGISGGSSEEVTSVTVPAGQTVELSATITLSAEDKTYIQNGFENGTYVEGYLYANAADEDGVNLALPFLGFYGDWSAAPVFDREGEQTSLYERTAFTESGVLLGANPYIRGGKSGDQYSAFSYSNPLAEIDFGMLRNAKQLQFVVTDNKTGEEYFNESAYNIAKSFYNASYGQILPFFIYNATQDEEAVWRGYDKKGGQLADGTEVTYSVNAYLDDGDMTLDDSWSFGVRLDNYAPEILNQYELEAETDAEGHTTLTLEMKDNQYIAAVLFINSNDVIMGKYEVDNVPGEAAAYTFDITGYGSDFTVLVGDYACNETEIDVSLSLENADKPVLKKLDKNRIYGCETYDAAAVDSGWFSANKQDLSDPKNETFDNTSMYYSGEYVNGYVMAQSAATGDLVLLTPNSTYWDQQTLVSQNGKHIGEQGVWVLYDMALDYSGKGSEALGYDWNSKSVMLAVGWLYAGDNNGDGKDDGYNALFQIELYKNGYMGVEDVAKITGTEDGVELLTLGCTTEGQLYGIDTNGKLYRVSFDGKCEYVGTTDFVNELNYSGCNVIQSMGYDHNTDTMYWYAHSQTAAGNTYVHVNKTYQVNLETAECTYVGSYGAGGQTALFVPTDLESDLFTMGVDPTSFQVSPYELTMAVGQTQRLEVTWDPWNAKASAINWTTSDPEKATVNSSGYVTAVSEGDVTITATAQVWAQWDGAWVDREVTVTVHVVGSAEGIYGYIISDYANNTNDFAWHTYSDQTPGKLNFITRQEVTTINQMGETVTGNAIWQGGAYYNGYVYTVNTDMLEGEDGTMGSASVLYRSKVTKGATPAETTIGAPERIGGTIGVEVGNLGFDYNTSRMYCVSYSTGGLGIIDLDTGAVDLLGTFSGDIGGQAVAPAMCVTADGTIVISDMYGNLYTVDCDTLDTKKIGSINADSWYYAGMTYDYNTGNIYWNPCMGSKLSPFYLVRLGQNQWSGETEATLVKLGGVSGKAGVEQTAMFTIPDNEPESHQIPTKSIDITNSDVVGLVGGSLQLNTVTEPARPTVQAKTWTSSDESVVTVDRYGKLSFKGVGTATVTVSISNKNPADGGPFTDSVKVTVYEAAGQLTAFIAEEEGGSGYYSYWLDMYDYDVQASQLETRALGVYDMRSGTYYDGYFYGYNRELKFLRVNAGNRLDYTILTDGPAEGLTEKDEYGYVSEQVTAMAYDYTTATMYGLVLPVHGNMGYLASINLDTGAVTKLHQLDAKVFALAIDEKGVLYAAGSADYISDTVLYTVDKNTGACTKVMDLPGARVFTGENNYGEPRYNAQMTYDFTTKRLYLNATYKLNGVGGNTGLFMIDPDENLVVNLGKPAIDTGRGRVKVGDLYLALLCAMPEEDELPESGVTGILISKEASRVALGGTITLKARVRPSNASNQAVIWSSSNETVAAVDENGVVTGVSSGTAVVTATSVDNPAVSASCTVTVVAVDGPQSVGYTVSSRNDSLIRFNPELPGTTAEVVSAFSGGTSIAGMTVSGDTLWYLQNVNGLPQLYRYDMTSKQTTSCGALYTFSDANDMAYDPVRNMVYVTSGFYVFQFDVSKLTTGGLNWYTDSRDISGLTGQPTSNAVTVVDGDVYFLGMTWNGLNLYKIPINQTTGAFTSPEIVLSGLPVSTDSMASELDYDSSKELFYVTDAANRLYSFDWDGNVTLIDTLGDGLDFNGLAIVPAA